MMAALWISDVFIWRSRKTEPTSSHHLQNIFKTAWKLAEKVFHSCRHEEHVWERWNAIGNRDCALKGMCKLSHTQTQSKGNNWKAACQMHSLVLEGFLERWKQMGPPLGTQILTAAFLKSSLYHRDLGADQCHFGVLRLTC